MAMDASEIEQLIRESLPDAQVTIQDLAGDGTVHGLDSDGFGNDDRFLLHLKNLVRDYIGIQFARYMEISLHDLEGGQVALVQSLPSKDPVFFRRDKQEYFYVRVGPSTQALTPSQLISYIATRTSDQAPSN